MKDSHLRYHSGADSGQAGVDVLANYSIYRLPTYFARHDLPSASRRRKMLPCTEEEVEALFYFISNLYLTLYPIRTLSIPFPNFTAVHGVGVAQAKHACKHTIATRKCYQYNQKLLNICDQYSNDHDLIYNSKKTMCMSFTPKSFKSHECKLSLNQESLSYVREARYLGVVIQSSGTDKEVHRQMRK